MDLYPVVAVNHHDIDDRSTGSDPLAAEMYRKSKKAIKVIAYEYSDPLLVFVVHSNPMAARVSMVERRPASIALGD